MKKLKIGVFGAGRGVSIAKNFMMLDCEIVAVCDFRERPRLGAIEALGSHVVGYADFDSFIEHDMDAVIVANYFHEHAEYAIKCLERGIHVYSECLSNGTMAKGVALIRAAEKSNAI
jgi:predicted dehydrogenase